MADVVVAFAFLLFVVGIVGTIWVWIDATVNSSQSAILWGLVAFFGGILGILLYVLLGRDGGDGDENTADSSDLPSQFR